MLHPFVIIAILAVVSLPAFALFCWIMFDDLRNSTESIVTGVLKTLVMLVSFRLFAFFMSEDDDNSMFNVVIAIGAYVMLIVGEYALLGYLWPDLFSTDLKSSILGG